MFERISNGFAMAKSSWHVVMSDKKLLWFPVVSGLMFLVVVASFWIPLGILFEQGKLLDANGKPHIWFYPVAFAFYFCTNFVIVFCNAALVSCALMKFNGQETTLGDGFRAAMSRLPQIFMWALVSATVGMLLKAIENANEKVGYWIAAILGTAWSIMTYFVVPILVVEKVGPFQAVSRSTKVMKQTWGEALTGKMGIGLFLFLLSIPLIILFVISIVVMMKMQMVGLIMLIATGILFLLYLAVSAALNTVFMTAVFQFATEDKVPEGFERRSLAHAFASK